jgi:DNA invertase Pin-like site-specific DNA recombinase
MRKLSQETRDAINAAYNAGMLYTEIAREFGVHRQSISKFIDNKKRRLRLTEEQIQCIIDKYASGKNTEEIAIEMGIDGETVRRKLHESNVIMRPNKRNKK